MSLFRLFCMRVDESRSRFGRISHARPRKPVVLNSVTCRFEQGSDVISKGRKEHPPQITRRRVARLRDILSIIYTPRYVKRHPNARVC